MKAIFKLFVISVLVSSCAPSASVLHDKVNEKDVVEINENQIFVETAEGIEPFTQVNFEKHPNSYITRQVMFDNFKEWSDMQVSKEDELEKLLIWRDISLIEGVNKKFTVIASGSDTSDHINNFVLVYDDTGKDALASDSVYKDEIINFFTNKIQTANQESAFYKTYLTTYYPETWVYIAQAQKSNKNSAYRRSHPVVGWRSYFQGGSFGPTF